MIRLATLTVLLGLVLAAAAGAQEKLRIATEGAYPPFNTVTADGELSGFDVDIAKALCEEMDRECEIVAQDWDGIIPGLVNDKYDAIVASMSITEERKQTVDFTDPYYSNYLVILAEKDSGLTPENLEGKSVGAQRATVAGQWAEDNLGRRATIKLYDTQTAAYSDLEAGRLDAIVSDAWPALDWVESKPDFEISGERIDIDDKIGIAVRKGEEELKEAFNEAIAAIRENGTYAEINARYFPIDIF